jgi:hypothetical protein
MVLTDTQWTVVAPRMEACRWHRDPRLSGSSGHSEEDAASALPGARTGDADDMEGPPDGHG